MPNAFLWKSTLIQMSFLQALQFSTQPLSEAHSGATAVLGSPLRCAMDVMDSDGDLPAPLLSLTLIWDGVSDHKTMPPICLRYV